MTEPQYHRNILILISETVFKVSEITICLGNPGYYYFLSEIQIGMLDSLIYLMLFGLFAGLSSYYVVVWTKKITGSQGGWS